MKISSTFQSLYVGRDWLMYVGPDGFHRSEMLSSSLLIGKPGQLINCCIDNGSEVSAKTILHSACSWSSAAAPGLIVIYFDPLSDAARAIQSKTKGQGLCAINLETACLLEDEYEALISGSASPEFVLTLIDNASKEIAQLGDLQALDKRVAEVAAQLSKNFTGRLNLDLFASLIGVSSVRLRQLFKAQTGMTLSKYKIWQQLHGMFRYLAANESKYFDWNSRETTQNAGFYDDAHGYRTMGQYFGPRHLLRVAELRLINCLHSRLTLPTQTN